MDVADATASVSLAFPTRPTLFLPLCLYLSALCKCVSLAHAHENRNADILASPTSLRRAS